MKIFRLLSAVVLVFSCAVACESSDGGRKKKRTRPLLPGESESDLSWSRPTKSTDVTSPFGLPTSR